MSVCLLPFQGLRGQVVVDQVSGPPVLANCYENRNFLFKGRYFQDVYDNETDSVGLVFSGGSACRFSGNILLQTPSGIVIFEEKWHDSPVLNVRDSGTSVYFSGRWNADNNYSKPILNLGRKTRFVFGKEARFNLIFPAYGNFTRQLWARSDGTGIIELEKGFIADRSEKGTRCEGTGCFRMFDCRLITHDSASLPVYYRPEPTDPSRVFINSHLVFERGDKSVWEVKTQKQNFIGGLWLYRNMRIHTDRHLKLTGRFAHWSDYTNYGGLIFVEPNLTLTKTGKDTLTLDCDTHFPPGSRLLVKEGTVCLRTNPWKKNHSEITGLRKIPSPNGQNLEIVLQGTASLVLEAEQVSLKALVREGKRTHLIYKGKSTLQLPESVFQAPVFKN